LQPTPPIRWKNCCLPGRSPSVKSNAIVVTRDRTTVGIGAGQMNASVVKIALEQAWKKLKEQFSPVMAFPFDDSVGAADAAG